MVKSENQISDCKAYSSRIGTLTVDAVNTPKTREFTISGFTNGIFSGISWITNTGTGTICSGYCSYGYSHIAGIRQYELTNHLGNVMATVNDRKVYEGSGFVAMVMSAQTYYPGGSIEAGRMMNSSAYRFGQNTQEADMEISGTWGTHYTAEFWEYDARLMRRWNVDPVLKEWESPYLCFSGNPIWYSDPAGDNAGHWLTRSGKDLGDDGRSDDNAYVVEDELVDNYYSKTKKQITAQELRDSYENYKNNGINLPLVNQLSLTWTDFQKMRNWGNGEIGANDTWEAIFAVNSAIVNWSIHEDGEGADLTSFLNGKLNAKYNETYRGWYDGSSPLRKQRANAGTINALLGGHDYSNGGWQWDGKEQATMFNGSIPSITFTDKNGKEITWNSKAWSQGWTISDDHYKTWKTAIEREGGTFIAPQKIKAKNPKLQGQIQLHSTACYGTTIFWDVITK